MSRIAELGNTIVSENKCKRGARETLGFGSGGKGCKGGRHSELLKRAPTHVTAQCPARASFLA